jgi:TRAP-type C4-dicarboxylate transport system substrate-binding protein
MNQPRKIRWLLEHEPVELFLRTAVEFDKRIRALTNNEVQIEIYKKEEYMEKFGTSAEMTEATLLLNTNDIQMTQIQIVRVGQWYSPDFFALEMPFLFDSHEHATRVLDGEIGQRLLDSIEDNAKAKGLAFTYSGGYRVLASSSEIKTAEDLKGLTCVTDMSGVRVDTAKAFGLTVTPYKDASLQRDLAYEKVELYEASQTRETTLPRYEAEAYHAGHRYIGVTNHSMFLTTILINKDFFASLTPEQQAAIKQVSKEVAVLEREWSVADAETYATDTAKHADMGITYTEFAEEEVAKLKEATAPLYDKYRKIFSPLLIDNIRSA